MYSLGKITFAALLGSVTLEVALVARYWTWVFFWIVILSYGLMYPYMLIFPYVELALEYYDPANIGVALEVLSSPVFWFVIFVCYILTFGSRLAEKTFEWVFRPHDTMILAEKEHIDEGHGGLLSNMSGESMARLKQLGTYNENVLRSKTLNEMMDEGLDENEFPEDLNVDNNVQRNALQEDSMKAWDSLRPGKVPV